GEQHDLRPARRRVHEGSRARLRGRAARPLRQRHRQRDDRRLHDAVRRLQAVRPGPRGRHRGPRPVLRDEDGVLRMSSLEQLRQGKNAVEMLRHPQAGPNVYPGVPAEYTNWRDEQLAWQHSCVLFNQSYHMADLAVRGPDALTLLSNLGVNSFKGFVTDKAKQFVPCTPDGYVIGDVILFALDDRSYN